MIVVREKNVLYISGGERRSVDIGHCWLERVQDRGLQVPWGQCLVSASGWRQMLKERSP